MCNQCSPRVNAGQRGFHAQARKDPTHTTMIRKAFEKDVNRRFAQLKKLIRETLIENDALGLKTNAEAAGRKAFEFIRSGAKVEAFMDWLRGAQDDLLLEVRRGRTIGTVGNQIWADVYVDTAYQRGLAQAARELSGQGVSVAPRWVDSAFYRPVHADAAGLIYTRVFSDLKGITEAMDQQISRVLAQGLLEGRSSDAIAKSILDRVDKIGRTRARMLARSEVVAAHSAATLNAYEEAKIEGVQLRAEFQTAGDDAVCEECEALASKGTYSIEEARGLIPVHPNCRCAWVPVVINPETGRLA